MTALEIAMAGYLAFGQPTGNYYEAITKHAGLQAIHPDGAVTLRLAEVGREELAADGANTIVVRLKDELYPFEVTRYVKTWGDCAAVETWAEIRHSEAGPVRLVRADSFASPVVVTSDVVRVLSLTGIAKNEANVSRSPVGRGQAVELVSSAGTRNAWEANAAMMVEFGEDVDEERGKVLGVALEWPGNSCRRVRRNWDGSNNGKSLQPGDTHIVYPGTDGPWSSARLEATRAGMEDADLLTMLRRRDKAKADGLVRRIARGFHDYTPSCKLYREVRRDILQALEI